MHRSIVDCRGWIAPEVVAAGARRRERDFGACADIIQIAEHLPRSVRQDVELRPCRKAEAQSDRQGNAGANAKNSVHTDLPKGQRGAERKVLENMKLGQK